MTIDPQIQPTLTQIAIYPIKSLDGKIVDRAEISAGGALAFDRRWAIVDERGKIINAKRTAKIHQLRSQFDLGDATTGKDPLITIRADADLSPQTFSLRSELAELAVWLGNFFGFPVSIVENAVSGFPDDLAAYGPTIVSKASLEKICTWFPNLNLAEVRRRFRTNLELDGVPAFWEDRLFAAPDATVQFRLGDVRFEGINPCHRCPVPTRSSLTGEVLPGFQSTFSQQRQQTISSTIDLARFKDFYRLSTNTQIPLPEVGKFLNIGDRLRI
jgi:uncharacterized protein